MKYDNMLSCPICEEACPPGEGYFFNHISKLNHLNVFECFGCGTLMLVPREEWP